VLVARGDSYFPVVAAQNRLYLNDGRGSFKDGTSGLPVRLDATYAIALADVNRDGRVDVLFANNGTSFLPIGAPNVLLINQGSGRFADETATRLPPANDRAIDAAFADVDRDGNLDIVLVYDYLSADVARVLAGDAQGKFRAASLPRFVLDRRGFAGGKLLVDDIDRDGDPDVFLGSALFVNRHRQHWSLSHPRIGRPWELAAMVEPERGPVTRAVLPIVGVTELRPPLAIVGFGFLRVSPTALVMLPPQIVPTAATWQLAIPNAPQLVGQRVLSQLLIVDGPSVSTWGLSNLVADRVLR